MHQLRHAFPAHRLGASLMAVEETLIAGIGSPFGDDRLGWDVVEKLAGLFPEHTFKTLRKPIDLLDHLSDVERLHLIDAGRGDDSPGTIRRFDRPFDSLNDYRFSGTHDIDLVSALRLAESFSSLPLKVTIWCITASPTRADPTFERSPTTAASIDELVGRIGAELKVEMGAASPGKRHA